MRRGRLIVFIGVDGSGKTTQAKLLLEDLADKKIDARYVWCRWDPFLLRPFIRLWKRQQSRQDSPIHSQDLPGDSHKKKLLENPIFRFFWLASFFVDYGLQLFSKIRMPLLRKELVVSDRIFYDSIIDQMVNLGDRGSYLEKRINSRWMRLIFPEPDLVMYIDCPAEIALSRKNDAPNVEYLAKRREIYLSMAKKNNWTIIDGSMLVQAVFNQVKEVFYRTQGLECQKS